MIKAKKEKKLFIATLNELHVWFLAVGGNVVVSLSSSQTAKGSYLKVKLKDLRRPPVAVPMAFWHF